jgi:hypothetical protein
MDSYPCGGKSGHSRFDTPGPGQLTRLPVSANIAKLKNPVMRRLDLVARAADTPTP